MLRLKAPGSRELRDVGGGDRLLAFVGGKNDRTVLRPDVRSLSALLRRVVRHREENLQQLTVGDLRRVIGDLHRLGVSG